MCGWAVVALGLFVVLLLQYRRYARMVLRRLSSPSPAVDEVLVQQVNALNVRQRVLIRVSSGITTPAVFGFIRPVILIPELWNETLSPGQLSNVISHELAHIKRWDMQIGWLTTVINCFYWFHPVVWIANVRIRREREMACDDLVMVSAKQDGSEYASTIMRVVEFFDAKVPVGVGFLGLLEFSSDLLQRIRSLVDTSRSRRLRWNYIVGLFLVMIFFLPMGTSRLNPLAQTGGAMDEKGSQAVDSRITEGLLKKLKDPAPSVRVQALWVLRGTNDARIMEGLVAALDDEDRNVRELAIKVLGDIDTPELIEYLLKKLKDEDPEIRILTIQVLSRRKHDELTSSRITEGLLLALDDENERVRQGAISALAQMRRRVSQAERWETSRKTVEITALLVEVEKRELERLGVDFNAQDLTKSLGERMSLPTYSSTYLTVMEGSHFLQRSSRNTPDGERTVIKLHDFHAGTGETIVFEPIPVIRWDRDNLNLELDYRLRFRERMNPPKIEGPASSGVETPVFSAREMKGNLLLEPTKLGIAGAWLTNNEVLVLLVQANILKEEEAKKSQ
jgi:hypothetical protein